MRITDYLKRFNIAGLSFSELQDILNGKMPHVGVTNVIPGTIVIKTGDKSSKYNNVLLTCVKDYFTNEPSGKKLKLGNIKCFYVQRALGITDVTHGDCKSCFLKCLSYDSTKTIVRIKK